MRTIVLFVLLTGILATAAGCPGGGGAADAGPALDCGLELAVEIRTPDGTYAALDDETDAELILGFQGFRYVYLRGRVAAEPPVPSGVVRVELDGEAARSQPFGDVGYTTDGDGLVTQPLRVFFNDDPLPSLIDARCRLTLYVGGQTCGAQAGGVAALRYDPSCYEGPDGSRVCPDGGLPVDGGP